MSAPDAFESDSVNVSASSFSKSVSASTSTVRSVRPAGNVSVPETAV